VGLAPRPAGVVEGCWVSRRTVAGGVVPSPLRMGGDSEVYWRGFVFWEWSARGDPKIFLPCGVWQNGGALRWGETDATCRRVTKQGARHFAALASTERARV